MRGSRRADHQAQRIALIGPGHGDDRPGQRRREEQRAPLFRRGVEDLLQLLAEAEVEHLVGLVEDDGGELVEAKLATLQVVAQASRRADHDLAPLLKGAAFGARVHAADTGDDLGAGIEPLQLAAHLHGQLARRGDDQSQRRAGRRQFAIGAQQVLGQDEAVGDGLARAGAGGDQQVASPRLRFKNGELDRRQRRVATLRERAGQRRVHILGRHGAPYAIGPAGASIARLSLCRISLECV